MEAMQTEQYLLYGALYNRLAIENLELCPSGWHVATYTDYIEMSSEFQPDAGFALRSSPEDDPPGTEPMRAGLVLFLRVTGGRLISQDHPDVILECRDKAPF